MTVGNGNGFTSQKDAMKDKQQSATENYKETAYRVGYWEKHEHIKCATYRQDVCKRRANTDATEVQCGDLGSTSQIRGLRDKSAQSCGEESATTGQRFSLTRLQIRLLGG